MIHPHMYGPYIWSLYSTGAGFFVTDDFGNLVKSPIIGLKHMTILGVNEEH